MPPCPTAPRTVKAGGKLWGHVCIRGSGGLDPESWCPPRGVSSPRGQYAACQTEPCRACFSVGVWSSCAPAPPRYRQCPPVPPARAAAVVSALSLDSAVPARGFWKVLRCSQCSAVLGAPSLAGGYLSHSDSRGHSDSLDLRKTDGHGGCLS